MLPSDPGRGPTVLAWTGVFTCVLLMGPLFAEPSSPRVVATCDPATEPLVVVDGALRCEPVTVCGGGGARAGDVFAAAGDCVERRGRMVAADLEALAIPVDVTTATADELASLPGIGPELARRIAAARPFRSVDDLLRVDGIGPVRLAAMRTRVRISPPPS